MFYQYWWYSFPYIASVYFFSHIVWLIMNEISHTFRMRELRQLSETLRDTSLRLNKLVNDRDRL
jgi:hypothetical protein